MLRGHDNTARGRFTAKSGDDRIRVGSVVATAADIFARRRQGMRFRSCLRAGFAALVVSTVGRSAASVTFALQSK
jgi:hypothetical protein